MFYWNGLIVCPNCGQGVCSEGVNGDGECTCNVGWTSVDGNNCNSCTLGYIRNGIECIPCNENEYSVNETICLLCPENSISQSMSASILDCKCDSFNYYPDFESSTCLPCPLGYLLNESNICQSNSFLSFFPPEFNKMKQI